MKPQILQRITHALAQEHGFRVDEKEEAAFLGELTFQGKRVGVRLTLVDGDILDPPKIHLVDPPESLTFGTPNIGIDKDICYTTPGDSHLDRARPAEAVSYCIELAQQTLDTIADGEAIQRTPEEFSAYWLGTPIKIAIELENPPEEVALGKIGPHPNRVETKSQVGKSAYVVGHDNDQLQRIFDNRALFDIESNNSLVIIELDGNVVPAHPWPVDTIGQLVRWLRGQDAKSVDAVEQALFSAHRSRKPRLICLVRPPVGSFGFVVTLNAAEKFRNSKTYAKEICEGQLAVTKIARVSPEMVNGTFVATRNMRDTDQCLSGKHIRLIGLGTIGGWLAVQLGRLGAGSGDGCLELIDPDTFGAGNIGRHVLGISDVDDYKSDAVRSLLLHQIPDIHAVARRQHAQDIRSLFDCDLVIDATGNQSFSYWLDEVVEEGRTCPVLYVWVGGNGDSAGCYLRTGSVDEGCYRCVDAPTSPHADLFKSESPMQYRTYQGCDSLYVPFPVHVPISAASMASSQILLIQRGAVEHKLIVHRFNPKPETIHCENPARSNDCPACN